MTSYLISAVGFVAILCSQYAVASFKLIPRLLCTEPLSMKSTETHKGTEQEAKQLWEQAITAKGGRARLYTVNNMVISSHTDYTTHTGKKNQVRREDLFVFPNKYWLYEDYGSDVFGVNINMFNYDSKQQYSGPPGDPETRLEPIGETERNKALDQGQISLLLETKWLKPILVKASTQKVDQQTVDIVETRIDGKRVDFAFDPKTHLPVRVSFYSVFGNKTYVDTLRLSDYVEVSGIKVPLTIKLDDGTIEKAVIHFNVEYNESIFIKPPSTAVGPEAWKISKR